MLVNVFVLSILLYVLPPVPVLPSPTRIPTYAPAPTAETVLNSDLYNYLATSAVSLYIVPEDVNAPGGVELIPKVNTSVIMGYGRWLFSTNSANELLGEQVAPVAVHFFSILTAVVMLTSVYFLIRFVVLIIKIITWLIQQALRLIPFIGAFVLQVPPTPTPMPAPSAPPINIPSGYNLWYFADNSVGWWNQIGSDKTQMIQIMVIVAIVVFSVISIVNYIRSLTSEKADE